jgi:hypothetical protein
MEVLPSIAPKIYKPNEDNVDLDARIRMAVENRMLEANKTNSKPSRNTSLYGELCSSSQKLYFRI